MQANSHVVAAIILAAGGATRMGRLKQLIEYQGQTLVCRAVTTALAGGCARVVVVVGRQAGNVRDALSGLEVEVVENKDWPTGIASSIHCGVDYLSQPPLSLVEDGRPFKGRTGEGLPISAAILLLCDQPAVTPQLIQSMARLHENGSSLIACSYGTTIGVPALFSRKYFPDLLNLTGDRGAKAVLQAHEKELHLIPFPEGLVDLDTPEDLIRLTPGSES